MAINFPTSPLVGQVYSYSGITYTYTAQSVWVVSSGGSGGAATAIADMPPSSPSTGQLWWESDTGNLYLWYNDGNSSQWVPATASTSSIASSGGGSGTTPGYVNVKNFGAIGNGSANLLSSLYGTLAAAQVVYPKATSLSDSADWCAIQAAVDYAITNSIYKVFIPDGVYLTTDTIHLGYGFVAGTTNFTSVCLEGVGYSAVSGLHGGTEIHPQFTDRPVINIQGGRQTGVRRLAIYGAATFSGPLGQTLEWRRDASNYVGSGAVDNRNQPFCGVCIDGYSGSGTTPSNPYPVPRYAAYCGTVSNHYSAALSSAWFVEECLIYATLIGVMSQPYLDGNGDFGKLHNTAIQLQKVAVAVGNSQARNMDFSNLTIDECHTCFDSFNYGHGVGNIQGNWANLSLNGIYRILHGSGGWSEPLCLVNCYAESGMIIGDFSGGTVTFESCAFSMQDYRSSGTTLVEWVQEPIYYGNAEFRRCIFTDRIIYHFGGSISRLHRCVFGNNLANVILPTGMDKALELFGHVLIDLDNDQRPGSSPFSDFNTFYSPTYNGTQPNEHDGYNSFRGRVVWGIGQKDNNYNVTYDVPPMVRFSLQSGSIGSLSGVTRTLTPAGDIAGTSRVGDVFYTLGYAHYYTSAIGSGPTFAMTLKALTWFKMAVGGTYSMFTGNDIVGGSFDPTTLGPSATYYPVGLLDLSPSSVNAPRPDTDGLFMKTTAGSATVSFISYASDTETAANRPTELLITSKPLWMGCETRSGGNVVPFPKYTTISNLTPTATSITMSANALVTGVWLYGPGIKRIR